MKRARSDARKHTASATSDGFAEPAQRDVADRDLERGVVEVAGRDEPRGHAVGEHPGADEIRPHAVATLLGRERAHEHLDGALRSRGEAVTHRVAKRRGGGHRNHGTLRIAQVRNGRMHEVEEGDDLLFHDAGGIRPGRPG